MLKDVAMIKASIRALFMTKDQDGEEDILYTHAPEKDGGIQQAKENRARKITGVGDVRGEEGV